MKKPSTGYLPTPEEIQEACARIRATWSERERQRRAGTARSGAASESWTPPGCRLSELRMPDDPPVEARWAG